MNKKKTVITVIAVLILAVICAGLFLNRKNQSNESLPENEQASEYNRNDDSTSSGNDKKDTEAKTSEQSENNNKNTENQSEKTPVFMYFVSESDENYEDAVKVFEELKKEYSGKIEFDLKNVTKDPSLLENFSLVDGNTPALIMDGKDGIVGFQFKMTDKDTLKSEIEKALK